MHKYADKYKYGRIAKTSFNGLGYAGNNLKEFQTISDYLNEAINNSKMERLPEEGKELLKILLKDPYEFGQKIFISNTADQTYYEIPIFKFIKPEDFFKIFLELGHIGKSVVIGALRRDMNFKKQLLNYMKKFILSRALNCLSQKESEKRRAKSVDIF